MAPPNGISIGQRIKAWEDVRGFSHLQLSQRAGVSYSLLTKVVAGARPATPEFINAVARALTIAPDDLNPAPTYSDGMPADPLAPLMEPIRTALDLFDLPPKEDVHPRPIGALRAAVKHINALAQAADYKPMCQALPGLIAELHCAAYTFSGEQQQQAWGLLAEASRCGHSVGIAIGMPDLSAYALSRMDLAAQQAGDRAPGLRAARSYLRVTAYLRTQDLEACRRLQDAGRAHLEGTDAHTPGALVAQGQLHLGSAVVAARAQDVDLMNHHLDQAERIAQLTGETSDFSLHFGPTNVSVHRVMTLVESGKHDKAVVAARQVRFREGWAPTRVGHHHIDLARANLWLARPEAALNHLDCAYEAAPHQATRHPLVKETVTGLARAGVVRNKGRLSTWITRTGV
ncbi:helix-turn-helix domain-containing protein [Kitasatospora sp. NPDC004745]|uniref:helix-turn-helix domain-containing protein n=1 Tax=Kitasatospora sp. NPDC004745 TaxID=3364019 RepID=UPI0036A50A3F